MLHKERLYLEHKNQQIKSSPATKLIVPTATLAHGATISPPHRGSSEHAIRSEDRRGFGEWRQRCGRRRGTLRHAHGRRAFGQRSLGEGDVRNQIYLEEKKKKTKNKQQQKK